MIKKAASDLWNIPVGTKITLYFKDGRHKSGLFDSVSSNYVKLSAFPEGFHVCDKYYVDYFTFEDIATPVKDIKPFKSNGYRIQANWDGSEIYSWKPNGEMSLNDKVLGLSWDFDYFTVIYKNL